MNSTPDRLGQRHRHPRRRPDPRRAGLLSSTNAERPPRPRRRGRSRPQRPRSETRRAGRAAARPSRRRRRTRPPRARDRGRAAQAGRATQTLSRLSTQRLRTAEPTAMDPTIKGFIWGSGIHRRAGLARLPRLPAGLAEEDRATRSPAPRRCSSNSPRRPASSRRPRRPTRMCCSSKPRCAASRTT